MSKFILFPFALLPKQKLHVPAFISFKESEKVCARAILNQYIFCFLCVSLTDYLSLCNASVAFSSFDYNLTGLERPKPLSATLRLLGLKKQRAHCLETFSFSLDWASKAEKMDINCNEFAENAESLLRKHFQYGCTFTSQVYIHLKDRSYWERLRFVSKF